jgi:hypothetical protein
LRVNKDVNRETISHAYVLFTKQLFGGKVTDYDNTNYEHFGNPDIVNDPRKQVYEVKSSFHKRKLDLKNEQLMRYERIMDEQDYECYYMIWAFDKVRLRKKSSQVIRRDTVGLLAVSTDVLSPILDGLRRETDLFFSVGLRKEFWRRLHFSPREGLQNLGLNPRKYNIEKRAEVYDVKFRNRYVDPFEMTTIINKKLKGLELMYS